MGKVLIIFPQSTHPVTSGSQVRVNNLIRHLCQDLGWTVDYYCPQGMLRPESWGPNMGLLRAIYIPKALKPEPVPQRIPMLHTRKALSGGLLESLVRDFREMLRAWRDARKKTPPPKTFELLSFVNQKKPAALVSSSPPPPVSESPVSMRLARYDAAHYSDSLRSIIERENYDVVLVTYVWMSRPLEWLFKETKRPLLVCDTIDVQYVREGRLEAHRDTQPVNLEKEKKLELSYLSQYDVLLTITQDDQRELAGELPNQCICTVNIEADALTHQPLDEAAYTERQNNKHKYDLVFAGANNEANALAVEVLLTRILPRLVAAKPDITLAIAGKICEHSLVKSHPASANLILRNYVPSCTDFYAEGRVLAAPIPAGGGVKVKVLEAMANALGVVTTEIGAEGISFTSGVHGFIADSDEAFVEAVLRLLEDPGLLREVSLAAQRFVFEHFSSQTVYRDFDQILANPSPAAVKKWRPSQAAQESLVPLKAH